MNLRWTPDAAQDRQDIFDYFEAGNPAMAVDVDAALDRAAEALTVFPMMGRVGKLPNTREIVVESRYRLVYQIIEEIVWVLAVVHTARRWPPFKG